MQLIEKSAHVRAKRARHTCVTLADFSVWLHLASFVGVVVFHVRNAVSGSESVNGPNKMTLSVPWVIDCIRPASIDLPLFR